MKLWIDDVRIPGKEWAWAKTSQEAIDLLIEHKGEISTISFDHDLGGEDDTIKVANWLEEQIIVYEYPCPLQMFVHSDNGPGRVKLKGAIFSMMSRATKKM